MTRLTVLLLVALFLGGFIEVPGAVAESDQKADAISAEDYALYDQVVTSKFLTSATQLVVIERMTRLRLSPDEEGPTMIEAFQEQGYFDGELPADLIRGVQFGQPATKPARRTISLWCRLPVRHGGPDRGAGGFPGPASHGGSREIGSGLAGPGSSGLLSCGAKPPQRSCADVCRSSTSRRHRSGIPRVVSSPRTKVDVVRYGSRVDHPGSARTRRRATACALSGLDGSMRP